jgi:hypothetical protein
MFDGDLSGFGPVRGPKEPLDSVFIAEAIAKIEFLEIKDVFLKNALLLAHTALFAALKRAEELEK